MRLRACHGLAMFALLCACGTVPEAVKVDVGGHSFEIKKKPVVAEPENDEPR